MNALLELQRLGQNIWLDAFQRQMLRSGELARMIREDGLGGVNSGGAAFREAVMCSDDYTDAIYAFVEAGATAEEIDRQLLGDDMRNVADLFLPLHEWVEGYDGFVSSDISPHLAQDTAAIIATARQLWAEVNRPNLLIRIPATRQAIPAIQQLLIEGISVNATLINRLPQFEAILNAYFTGMERRLKQGKALEAVTSVASFSLTSMDREVNACLDQLANRNAPLAKRAQRLKGRTAIASAKLAYQSCLDSLTGKSFQRLEAKGAKPQFLLWVGHNGHTTPEESVRYIDALAGPHTISAMPPETLRAYRQHGQPRPRVFENVDASRHVLEELQDLEIDLEALGQRIELESLQRLTQSYDAFLNQLREKTATRIAG